MEMEKKQEAGTRKVESLRDRHSALSDKYVSLTREHGDKIKALKSDLEKQKLQGAIDLQHLIAESEKRFAFTQEQYETTKREKEGMSHENQNLRAGILNAKMEHEISYKQ
jgi:hypothetical protein